MKKHLLLPILCLFIITACSSDDAEPEFAAENQAQIEQYLADNNLTAISRPSGLYYIVEEEGNGEYPTLSNNVTVTYRGYKPNGTEFDSSSTPISFPLTGVIAGWQEGIPLFSVGGSGKLFIPAHLAYGAQSPSNNGVIIFDVALLGFD